MVIEAGDKRTIKCDTAVDGRSSCPSMQAAAAAAVLSHRALVSEAKEDEGTTSKTTATLARLQYALQKVRKRTSFSNLDNNAGLFDRKTPPSFRLCSAAIKLHFFM